MSAREEFEWDAFVCHASEDKESFVEPLVAELQRYGLKVWFDKFTLHVGSSLRQAIDNGLAKSRFGVVVVSHAFFAKNWPQKELNALFSRQADGQEVILPVWHALVKEDVLRYSPLLSDMVAAKSTDGLAAVARSLVGVIRPSAFHFHTSRADAENAVSRIREQVQDNYPGLDLRVTIGRQELDPTKMLSVRPQPDLVASGTISSPGCQEGTRIDLFATDRETYNRNPLSFGLKMTSAAWEKLEEAQKKGKTVELGPEEVIEVSSDLFQYLKSSPDEAASGGHRVIVGPPRELTERKFRFKLTFTLGCESQEYPYVEFETVRPGREEIEIRSIAPPMPLQLTLTLNLVGSPSAFSGAYSWVGYEIREIYKAQKALRLMAGGGTMEIVNVESGGILGVIGAAHVVPQSEADLYAGEFIGALHEVAAAFDQRVIWTPNGTRDDNINLCLLQEVVRTGQVAIPADDVTVVVPQQPGANAELELRRQSHLVFPQSKSPSFATVLATTFDVGPYVIIIQPLELETIEDRLDSRVVRIVPAQPLIYQFEKFRSTKSAPTGQAQRGASRAEPAQPDETESQR